MPASQHATLYVRASIPNRVRRHVYGVVDDLRALADAGRLDRVDVETWDARVPLSSEADRLHSRAREAYARLTDWADETDRSLEPYFQVREGPGAAVLVPPIACLVVESDDGVEAVYPSEDGESQATVADGVRSLSGPDPVAAD